MTSKTEISQILVVVSFYFEMVKIGDSCEHANEPSSSMKRWEPDWQRLLASLRRFCYVELAVFINAILEKFGSEKYPLFYTMVLVNWSRH